MSVKVSLQCFSFKNNHTAKGFAHQYVFGGFDPVRTLKDASVKLVVVDEGTSVGSTHPATTSPSL